MYCRGNYTSKLPKHISHSTSGIYVVCFKSDTVAVTSTHTAWPENTKGKSACTCTHVQISRMSSLCATWAETASLMSEINVVPLKEGQVHYDAMHQCCIQQPPSDNSVQAHSQQRLTSKMRIGTCQSIQMTIASYPHSGDKTYTQVYCHSGSSQHQNIVCICRHSS